MCHPLLAVYSAKQLHVHCHMKSTGLEQVKITIFFSRHPQRPDPIRVSVGIWDFSQGTLDLEAYRKGDTLFKYG